VVIVVFLAACSAVQWACMTYNRAQEVARIKCGPRYKMALNQLRAEKLDELERKGRGKAVSKKCGTGEG